MSFSTGVADDADTEAASDTDDDIAPWYPPKVPLPLALPEPFSRLFLGCSLDKIDKLESARAAFETATLSFFTAACPSELDIRAGDNDEDEVGKDVTIAEEGGLL